MSAGKTTAIEVLRGRLGIIDDPDDGTIDNEHIAAALVEVAETLDEVFARVKKGNSLVGMLVGRFPPKPKKAT